MSTYLHTLRNLTLLVIVVIVTATPAFAGFGFMGGGSISTVWGNDAAETGFRNGFNAGLIFDIPLNENVSLRPEALFIQKGSQTDVYDPFSDSFVEARGIIDYVEFPLLVSVKLNRASAVTTVFNVGPAVSVPINSQVELNGTAIDIANMHNFDVSAIIGAGLELGSGTTRFVIDFRMDTGLTNMFKDMTEQEIVEAVSNGNGQLPVLDVDGRSGLEYKNFTLNLSAGIMF